MVVPPIKCQGIKTKLLPWIQQTLAGMRFSAWIEPFMGSGVVGFNLEPSQAAFSDSNPHLIRFYQALQNRSIDTLLVRDFLESEGEALRRTNGEHYYAVRERFNAGSAPLDFLFLNRSCFNGLMRFNSRQQFNVPFCKKPDRFSKSYVTKICNQVDVVQALILRNDYTFQVLDFRQALEAARPGDLVYCDPPYLGRHVDYFDSWSREDELDLHRSLEASNARFALSTWHSNEHRVNESLDVIWSGYPVVTRSHFYHVGATESNRKPMLEALVTHLDAARSAPRRDGSTISGSAVSPPSLSSISVQPSGTISRLHPRSSPRRVRSG